MTEVRIEQTQSVIDGREGFRLHAEWGHVAAVLGGGHICEMVKATHPELNPFWRPPWKTIDPERYGPEKRETEYGSLPDGPLMAGIAGHSISFDSFGPPSAEETAAGLSTHGEAPALRWQILNELSGERPGVAYGVELPVAQIALRRELRVDPAHPVVYCMERARNLSRADRPICWNEHVTIGPPFLECGSTLVDMPATLGRVNPASYSDQMFLTPDADFRWPSAPLERGGMHNLRTTPDGRFARYTAQLLDPARELGYVAVSNPRAGLILVCLFQRRDFPWVGNWEERFYRASAPWGGNTFCRGLEFSTTPFGIPRREVVTRGPLFGESTYIWLPAASELEIRYMTLLADIPLDYEGVADIHIEGDAVTGVEHGRGRRIRLPGDVSFFRKTATEVL
ncbi:MAG: hypothetical protein WB524_13635 [Acidobacteriaceae bacterium]